MILLSFSVCSWTQKGGNYTTELHHFEMKLQDLMSDLFWRPSPTDSEPQRDDTSQELSHKQGTQEFFWV